MSQQDGDNGEPKQRSRNTAASKSVRAEENSREVVTKLVSDKVEKSFDRNTGATKIRPEPRRFPTMPLVEVDQDDALDEAEAPEPETVARLEADNGKYRTETKSHEITLAKFEKREQLPSEDVKQEEQWEENKSVGWWVAIGGAFLVLVLVGAVLLSNQWDAIGMKQVEAPQIVLPTEENPFAGTPEEWLRARAGNVTVLAGTVLNGYAAAKDDQERSRWVRNPETFLKRAPTWPGKILPSLDEHNTADFDISHIDDTGYLVLLTKDRDFMPMRIYFVRQGEELKIDWDASTAWSEMSMDAIHKKQMDHEKQVAAVRKQAAEAAVHKPAPPQVFQEPVLPARSLEEPVMVRCLMRRRNEFYAGPYNDIEHSSYMIAAPGSRHSFWAYVERDSLIDLELKRLLDHGSFVVSLKDKVYVTLRVRSGKKDALPSQLELVELVQSEWLTP